MPHSIEINQYKWQGVPSITDDPNKHKQCQQLIEAIDPQYLTAYTSKLKGGARCCVESLTTHGGRHIVRMVTLTNGQRWVARFRIPSIASIDAGLDNTKDPEDVLMQREVDCLRLISQRTTVPVPQVIAYGTSRDEFGTPFIIMECLPGNCAMDLNFSFIPEEFKLSFFRQMANAQVQTSSMLFPMIGSLALADNGKVTIGPIPGIGGPFNTASDFLRAWAAAAIYPLAEDRLREACGPYADEIWERTCSFPRELSEMADRICANNNHGPFPLAHVDFGHNNIIVDPEYNILGVIDWEHAYAAPWEVIDYPLTLLVTPPPMDIPTNYDGDGQPKDEGTRAKYDDRDRYLEAVKAVEKELGIPSALSNVLGDRDLQNIATAMRLFTDNGKMGFYTRVLDAFRGET